MSTRKIDNSLIKIIKMNSHITMSLFEKIIIQYWKLFDCWVTPFNTMMYQKYRQTVWFIPPMIIMWRQIDVMVSFRDISFFWINYEQFIELEKCAWHHSVHKTCIKGKCKLIYIRMLHYNLSTTAWGLQLNITQNKYAK